MIDLILQIMLNKSDNEEESLISVLQEPLPSIKKYLEESSRTKIFKAGE